MLEGTATISDTTGQFLFAFDGEKIYDRNWNVLPNGTGIYGGDTTSTQAGIFIPLPGNPDVYYLFTADAGTYADETHGINYTVINRCLRNGLGDVVEGKKNLPLIPELAVEKICAVYHHNGTDIWVMAHQSSSIDYEAYLVTKAGITDTVVSSVGYNQGGTGIGQMKFSPDGSKLAVALDLERTVQIFDFDNQTGVVSNPTTVKISKDYHSTYGLEFSPDGSKLYLTTDNYSLRTMFLYQFNLHDPVTHTIDTTIRLIATRQYRNTGTLQLAPDGKIYLSSYSPQGNWDPVLSGGLDVIHQPNELDSLCQFEASYFSPDTIFTKSGLPSLMASYFDPLPQIYYSLPCGQTEASFRLTHTEDIASVAWHFGEPSAGDTKQSTQLYPEYRYASPGDYHVTADITLKNGQTMTARKKVIVHPVLEIDLGVDTLLCTGDSLILDITQTEEACYHWQDGSTNPTFVVSQPGTYWVEVRKWGCTARGTIHVEYGIPEMNLGSDTVLCESDTIVLDAGIYHAQYLWSDQSTNRQLMVTEPGTYWVEVRKGSCLLMDTIKVDYIYYPNPNKHNIDTLICEDTSLEWDVYQ